MFSCRNAFTFLLSLPLFLVAWAIAYIYAGTEGQTWEEVGLTWMFRLSIALHGMLYLWALSRRSWRGLMINVVFSVVLALVVALGILSCFPGTGSRYGNCGLDWLGGLALLNLVLLLPFGGGGSAATRLTILAAGLFAFPLTFGTAYHHLSRPLTKAIGSITLDDVCLLQQAASVPFLSGVSRITMADQVRLDWVIGERSPRLLLWHDGDLSQWRYGKRVFQGIAQNVPRPTACAPL